MNSPLLCIVGPTASGKSALALALAQKLGGEIISCDSMQIYRECDIVTAKPSRQEQELVPHHLLDIIEPDQRSSSAQWATLAREAISDIENRGRVPIVCGGTGFYLRALLEPEVLAASAPDEELRAQLEADLASQGAGAMHTRLSELNPELAGRLHANDTYRVLRALEIALSPRATAPEAPPFAAQIFALDWPREDLYARIETRVDVMLAAGAAEELRQLQMKWGKDAPALGGVGYKQMAPALEDASLWPEALETWKRDTRRYAKRQLTWFRHQAEATWLDARQPLDELVAQVEAQLNTE